MNQIFLSLGTLVMCFFLSVFFTEASRRLAGKIDFLDHPTGRKAHVRPVPLLGGLGIFLALIVGIYLPLAIFFLFRGAIVDTWPLMEDFVAGALKKSLLIKTSNLIVSHMISRLGEETRSDIEEIADEAFRAYEELKTTPPEDKSTILNLVKIEAKRIRENIKNWKKL